MKGELSMCVTVYEKYDNSHDGFKCFIEDEKFKIESVYDAGYCGDGCEFDLDLVKKAIEEYEEKKKESEEDD